jgi:NADH-quinone oxidoreductase subunit F
MDSWRTYSKVLLPDIPDFHKIEVYESKGGGYQAWKDILTSGKWNPKAVVEEVKKANIRGRGGAGFNAGLKWSFMPPKKEGVPRYLACNGDESEPGTCKDRRIFEYNPHAIIEGALIGCYAMEMDAAYIYIRGEYADWIDMMQKALDDAYAKGYAGDNILGSGVSIHVYLHRGAGAYICGEETSLMESLEGKRPYPRSKPPFPAQYGLWGKPTTINNVETLSHVPLVMRNGADWYLSVGAPTNPGPMLYGISGHVNRPGLYEFPSGMLITDLIYQVAGGIRNGKKLKAVVPGGSSVPILTAEMIEGVTMDADGLRKAGTLLGTAGMCVLDEDTDMVKFLLRVSKFYDHESCGQCTPCREGTGWFVKILQKIDSGHGTMRDLDLLLELCDTMEGRTVCALADAAAWPVRNTVKRFRADFEARVSSNLVAVS